MNDPSDIWLVNTHSKSDGCNNHLEERERLPQPSINSNFRSKKILFCNLRINLPWNHKSCKMNSHCFLSSLFHKMGDRKKRKKRIQGIYEVQSLTWHMIDNKLWKNGWWQYFPFDLRRDLMTINCWNIDEVMKQWKTNVTQTLLKSRSMDVGVAIMWKNETKCFEDRCVSVVSFQRSF